MMVLFTLLDIGMSEAECEAANELGYSWTKYREVPAQKQSNSLGAGDRG